MTLWWGDLDVRARGLSTRLLKRPRLEALAHARDFAALSSELIRHGFAVPEPDLGISAPSLERTVRRTMAERMAVLSRWSGKRSSILAVLFEEDEVRSLRNILRGVLAGAPIEDRLIGCIPTPGLPERALQELAVLPSVGNVGALLVAWNHPYGSAILPEATASHPSLFQLELALQRRFADRALAAARRAGRELEDYVRMQIDLQNAASSLALATQDPGTPLDKCFVPGGRRVTFEVFLHAATAQTPEQARTVVARAFGNTSMESVFLTESGDLGALERTLLTARIIELERAARRHPLGIAPVLAYVSRLRAETVDLERIVWGVALAVPPDLLCSQLVTPS